MLSQRGLILLNPFGRPKTIVHREDALHFSPGSVAGPRHGQLGLRFRMKLLDCHARIDASPHVHRDSKAHEDQADDEQYLFQALQIGKPDTHEFAARTVTIAVNSLTTGT